MAEKIFITGASSGIGESLAYYYAQKHATVGIAARRIERLQSVARKCNDLGGNSVVYHLDVSDQDNCKKAAEDFLSVTGGIDIVIANAGIGGEDNISSGDPSAINDILKINILGVTNTVIPFIPIMEKQGSGKIGIISSIASFRGLPDHGGYSSSKAALRFIADSWEHKLVRHKITITTILPGWIASEMTAKHEFKMAFLMDSDKAAIKIANAIQRGKRKLILPWQWNFIVPIFRLLPRQLIRALTPYKESTKK
ncbi:MAG TPA: SDR family NAD(P)-dependent oxidoreductase [Candidatus Marinimicrobia bacterium]|nr:SDR family NAD(P)-dependent oxidoreductase [Candidatus Neomarinimicrobiota bacterium]